MAQATTNGRARTGEHTTCFGCGRDNPRGLGLKMRVEGETLTADFTPSPHHEGWRGILHGGIICALLYEIMENWGCLNGAPTMARSVDARLVKPAPIGRPLTATAWLESRNGRELRVSARITGGGATVAEGMAELVEVGWDYIERAAGRTESR